MTIDLKKGREGEKGRKKRKGREKKSGANGVVG